MRGEYSKSGKIIVGPWELPPHVRRILPGAAVDEHGGGTTSACAENTAKVEIRPNLAGNYLRVRGEYRSHVPFCAILQLW